MSDKNNEELQDLIFSNEEPNYNPLDEQVDTKSYSAPNVNVTADDLNRPISEPIFTPPPIDAKGNSNSIGGNGNNTTSNSSGQDKYQKSEPFNPDLKNASKKENETAAKQMCTVILKGYEMLHQFGNKALLISEKKLNRLQEAGEINLNAMVAYDYGQQMRAGEFFKEYNSQVENTLTVSDEFKKEVTPVLERVLAKRGLGMTDEQLLIFLFGQDIAVKGAMIYQQKMTQRSIIEAIKEQTAGMRAATNTPPTSQPFTPPPPPTTDTATIIKNDGGIEQVEVTSDETNNELGISSMVISQKKKAGRPRKTI